ncbi:alpha-rhamnosidase [Paraflavitalea pollutisoli]|uniref:alpha-L-rhamnosidase-related protein n=1 Tax=Paraflavitalea pollutisoli TaxID=3034143 RepID=UPI0023EBA57F|nr:alpha-rhamnosidase [Paraflavitalea sp. H1-2-19X]
MKHKLLAILLVLVAQGAWAQQATWIWYPGDYEIWLANKMQNRRTEKGAFFPPFWRMDAHYVLMDFHKVFELAAPEEITIHAEGPYNIKIDSRMLPGMPAKLTIPAGKHRINIKVYNQAAVPALYVQGRTIFTDSSWLVTNEDKEWIDESGKVSDQSGTTWLKAGSWNFNEPGSLPSAFELKRQLLQPVSAERKGNSLLLDFGKETFGYLQLNGVTGKGPVTIYYGESKEEALSPEGAETLDKLAINNNSKGVVMTPSTKAFRYVNVQYDPAVQIDSVSMWYEYLPVEDKGSFRSSDEELNKIYDVAKYTLHLNTREFFIDGIKRDRWIWSGDANQSYLMNYYLLFDNASVRRTILALRGKDPVSSHINTIMDYTFYWFLGIYDYYTYSGDKAFLQQLYPRMQSLMEYCLGRRNKDGLMEGQSGDWVFIDWADGLSKQGEVSFEQMLLCRSLETMALCAEIAGDAPGVKKYEALGAELRKKLFSIYWNESKQALVHSRVNGAPTDNVTRYTNMFGIFFNYFNDQQKQGVKQQVLLNNQVPKITTPYMRFYELEALCALGEQAYVLKEMKDYWGGMLKLGATSFWEEYNPSKTGAEHYAMYGRPFGKSLCHAWGASPLYLLGRYYLGVQPTSPGYQTYSITPVLGGLQWMEGKVPVPGGEVSLYCSTSQIKVKGAAGVGTLRFTSTGKPVCKTATIRSTGTSQYEMDVEAGVEYLVTYKAVPGIKK